MDKSNLYEFYKEYIYNDKQLEETISELQKLHELKKTWSIFRLSHY